MVFTLSATFISKCDKWLLSRSSTSSESDCLTYFMKWAVTISDSILIIQLDLLPAPLHSCGPSRTKKISVIQRKTNIQGMEFPTVFNSVHCHTYYNKGRYPFLKSKNQPSSPLLKLLFLVKSVLSQFQIGDGLNLYLSRSEQSLGKKSKTFDLLNTVTLLKLVDSGAPVEIFLFLLTNAPNQSGPSSLFLLQKSDF